MIDTNQCKCINQSILKGVSFDSVYDQNGRIVNRSTRKKSGVYIIKENSEIVYVGMSKSCLYSACYRHFWSWKQHPKYKRITYVSSISNRLYQVAFIECEPLKTYSLESSLITYLAPRDNTQFLDSTAIPIFCPNCKEKTYEQNIEFDSCFSCGYKYFWQTGKIEIDSSLILPF